MATIPGVSDGELVRTTWGDAVADELNNNAAKLAAGTQTFAGAMIVNGTITANNFVKLTDVPTAVDHATRKDYVDDVRNDCVAATGDVMTGTLTINPTTDLALRICSTNPIFEWRNEGNSARHGAISASSSATSLAADGTAITFVIDGSERMRATNGYLLIAKNAVDINTSGVEIPAAGSSFEGRINSTTTTANNQNIYLRHMSGTDDDAQPFITLTRSSAATGCGGISQGSGNNSVFNAGSGGTHVATSDYRYKDELGPIDDPVGRLMALQPKRLRWKPISGTVGDFDGFVAHEVTPVEPSAVVGDKDAVYPSGHPQAGEINPQGLDEKRLVPLLTAALQDAHTQIAALTARLDALEAAA